MFPLLLALVSILGFVLEGNPELRDDVVDSALARIPVIGQQLGDHVQPLGGSGIALAIGLVGALWGGLGITVALRRAFDAIADVPRMEQPSGLKARASGLAVLVVLGLVLIGSTVLTGLAAGGGIRPGAERALALAGSLAVNAVALTGVFAMLSTGWRIWELAPGIALASVGAAALQALGGWFVDRAITGASETYGTFALVIGLLSWFLLAAHLLLFAAELNTVARWRLWPRSLAGVLEPADRRALRRSAAAQMRDARQRITVSFDDPEV